LGAYILRRLLLVIPTLLGIMIINFTLTQFVPGGPIEQIIARMEGRGDVFEGIAGGRARSDQRRPTNAISAARGLPADFIEELEREFGFDKPPLERFLNMMWNYIRFDFGESYFRSISVVDLVLEKMPVSITLGLWSTVIAYLVSIPLGIRKAVRDGSPSTHGRRASSSSPTRFRASSSRSCCSCSSRAAPTSRSSRCAA
jgi:microcin C transport system permease protein